jgi:hypothetical protein
MEAERRAPKSEALQALYWRSELLQLLSWLRGEGLGDRVEPPPLERFLGVDAATGRRYLDRLPDDGHLDRDGDWFALSARGLQQGTLEFAATFSELNRPVRGDCSADCWYRVSAKRPLPALLDEGKATADEHAGT